MGNTTMGKCEDGPKKSFYNETKREHFQGWYGGLQFGNVHTCNGLLKWLSIYGVQIWVINFMSMVFILIEIGWYMLDTHIFMKDKYGFKNKRAINKILIHLTSAHWLYSIQLWHLFHIYTCVGIIINNNIWNIMGFDIYGIK